MNQLVWLVYVRMRRTDPDVVLAVYSTRKAAENRIAEEQEKFPRNRYSLEAEDVLE